AGEDVLQTFLAEHGERFVQAFHQRDGRSPGRLVLALALAVALDVKRGPRQVGRLVQLPCLLAGGEKGEPRRKTQRLVAGAEQHVDAPVVHRQRHRPERADGVDHQDRTGPRGDLRQLADGMVDAGGALVRLDVYALRLGVLAQGLLDGDRLDRMAPLALQGDRVHPVRLRQLSPALAELAAVDDHGSVALAEEVDERGLHRAGAAGCEHEHVLLRLVEPGEPSRTRANTASNSGERWWTMGRAIRALREQFCQADVEGVGDRGQRLQMGSTLAALDHGKEGDADPGALAQFLLRHPRARRPQLPDPAADFPDDGRLYGPLPGSPPSAYVPAAAGTSKMLRVKVHNLNRKAHQKK